MSFDLSELWNDLRRRRVFQVAALYAAGAWIIVQVADVVGPAVGMPDRVMTVIVGMAMVGFPVAVLLAWLFDVGPGGVHRTRPGSVTGVLAIVVSVGLLGAGTAAFVWLIRPGTDTGDDTPAFELVENSVAVMPFEDLSLDNSLEHFGDGIAEVLIHQLSSIPELKVIPSDTSFLLRDSDADVGLLGRRLRAERLLMGSVQRLGERLRISTRLVDTMTGENVWAEQFDRQGRDIFDIQDEIALAVGEQMQAELMPAVRDRVTRPITDDLDAYDLYLHALKSMRKQPLGSQQSEAIAYLEQALAKDPGLALAWVALSNRTFWNARWGYLPQEQGIEASRDYLVRALRIDPELGEAYSQQILLASWDGDFDAARRAFDKAIEFSPSHWPAYLSFGIVLNVEERFTEAIDVLTEGIELQPYEPEPLLRMNLADAYVGAGDHDRGMRLYADLYQEHRGTALADQYLQRLAMAALRQGRYDEVIAIFESAFRHGHKSAADRAWLAQSYLWIGDVDAAARQVRRAEALLPAESANDPASARLVRHVDWARLLVDVANKDVTALLATAKALERRIDAAGSGSKSWWDDVFHSAVIYIHIGRYEDGARQMRRYLEVGPDAENYALAAFACQQIGNDEMAREYLAEGRRLIAELDAESHLRPKVIVWIALFHAVEGDVEAAMSRLQQAYDAGYREHPYLAYMRGFDSVRKDPRFIELLRLMREDTTKMRERVDRARESGDWQSITGPYIASKLASPDS